MNKLSDYVMIAEASKILGVSQNTVRKWGLLGKLKLKRNPANGYRLFLKADLMAFLHKTASSVISG